MSYVDDQYVRIEDNRLVVDKNLANIDIVNFKICRHIYRTYVNLASELQQNGYSISRYSFSKVIDKVECNPASKVTFKELFDEYCRLKETKPAFSFVSHENLCGLIAAKNPLVKQAYDELGAAKVQALKYHVGNIRRELIKLQPLSVEHKIMMMINASLPKQTNIAKSKIKEKLQKIYESLGVKQTAKASDLAK